MSQDTELIVVGAGAAGLMAAASAAEYGLRILVLERKNQPGRKLLMCGNNRCNLTSDLQVDHVLQAYGEQQVGFLRHAVESFPPAELRRWFARHRVPTMVKGSGRVYPQSERANDVVNCFKDRLRDESIPIVLNCPVTGIISSDHGFIIESANASFRAPFVLVATGGVSYPKTGSVGDGQKFARKLGHKVTPFRPGLAAFSLADSWWFRARDLELSEVNLAIFTHGKLVTETHGGIEIRAGVAHGPAIIDASNVIARDNLRDYRFEIDLLPDRACPNPDATRALLQELLGTRALKLLLADLPHDVLLTDAIRRLPMPVTGPRPLKEAMVTVGGIDIGEIDPLTMESQVAPGLYFAGEVMDVDGFCGGFNLQAAFSTGRLAVKSVAGRLGRTSRNIDAGRKRFKQRGRKGRRRR